jgi:hypothetical protein
MPMFLHCEEMADSMNVYMREIETWLFIKAILLVLNEDMLMF